MRGSVKFYHASGAEVAIAFEFSDEGFPQSLDGLVTWASEIGLSVRPTGAAQGETVERIGWLCRSDSERAGQVTPTVLFFPSASHKTHSIIRKYLNDEGEIREFEEGTGVRLRDLPNYGGDNKPERGKSPKTDRFIIAVKPFSISFMPNPDYDEKKYEAAKAAGTPYKTPKRVLTRYLPPTGDRGSDAKPGPSEGHAEADPMAKASWWVDFFSHDPPLEVVSERVREAHDAGLINHGVNQEIRNWRRKTGCEWDKDRRCFVPPRDVESY